MKLVLKFFFQRTVLNDFCIKIKTMTSLTENGALAYSTTHSALLDLFGQLTRDLLPSKLETLITQCWSIDPRQTLQLVAYTRDIRGGLGERRLFYYMSAWLMVHHPSVYLIMIPVFIAMGYFGDLLQLIRIRQTLLPGSSLSGEIDFFVEALNSNEGLAAKWAPSEGQRRFKDLAKEMAKSMGLTMSQYRRFLTIERKRLNLVETALCSKNYSSIIFEHVPSQAMLRYRKAFSRSTNTSKEEQPERAILKERFVSYLESVKKGETKINSGTLMPHQLVNQASDETCNVLWDDMVRKIRERTTGYLSESMAIIDVSGSMSVEVAKGVLAMDIAVALGLLIAEVSSASQRQVITFSETPVLATVPIASLDTKVKFIRALQWSMNTNFYAVFKLLINERISIKKLFVFSDMQFDAADRNFNEAHHHQIQVLYSQAGMTMPEIVYWNLAARSFTALPITRGMGGTALISGFSSKLLDLFMDELPLDPMAVLTKALSKYELPDIPDDLLDPQPAISIDWPAVTKAVSMKKSKVDVESDKESGEDENY